MKLFISWSGAGSERVGKYLDGWLRRMAIGVEPWVSGLDIRAGRSWRRELDDALAGAEVGLFLLTSDTQSAPFVCFEAGALAGRSVSVLPYLINFSPSDLAPVFEEFQSRRADHDGTWQLVQELHERSSHGSKVRGDQLAAQFAALWPELEKQLREVAEEKPAEGTLPDLHQVLEALGELRRDVRTIKLSAGSTQQEGRSPVAEERYQEVLEWAAKELLRRYLVSMLGFLDVMDLAYESTLNSIAVSAMAGVARKVRDDPESDVIGEDLFKAAKSGLESYFNMLHDTRRIDDETFQRVWHKIDAAHAPG